MILPYDINISRKYWLLVGWDIRFQLNHTLQGKMENRLYIRLVTFLRQGRSVDMLLNVAGKVLLKFEVLFYVLKQENELFSLPMLFLSLAVHRELSVSAHFAKMGHAECQTIKL
jgi:hypothetical protein